MTRPQARQQAAPPEEDRSCDAVQQSEAERAEPEARGTEAAAEPAASRLASAARRSGSALDRMESSQPARRFRLSMDRLEDNWALSAVVILVALVAGAILV